MGFELPYLTVSPPHKLTAPLVRVALVTYRGLPRLSADDQLLLAPLTARGVRADSAAWDDPAVRWDTYDALVIRSTWNYHTSFDQFHAW
ncbi:MAG TPA: hypothetical protein VG106_16000, partial [Vicinamibacterales bacterium]|nr:hypothetical protein [Vicinamibacterales bacterium]